MAAEISTITFFGLPTKIVFKPDLQQIAYNPNLGSAFLFSSNIS